MKVYIFNIWVFPALFFLKKVTLGAASLKKLPRHEDFPHISTITFFVHHDNQGEVNRKTIQIQIDIWKPFNSSLTEGVGLIDYTYEGMEVISFKLLTRLHNLMCK